MIKTQVQLPDHLYAEAKRIAEEHEMSFAEVVRRGVEKMSPAYPPRRSLGKKWKIPTPRRLGFRGLSDSELKDAAQQSAFEEELIRKRSRIDRH
jgi:hypothetical protein